MKKRMCEFCERNSCVNCAYAHPERCDTLQLIVLPEHLMVKCRNIASDRNLSVSEAIQLCIDTFNSN